MPKTTVGAIIIDDYDQPGKVLMTKRNIPPFKGQWCLPGGHIDSYEYSVQAVKREVREETGLEFEPTFFHYFDEIFQIKSIHNVVLMYYGKATGEMKRQEKEVAEIEWFSFDEALKLDLAFKHHDVLDLFIEEIIK